MGDIEATERSDTEVGGGTSSPLPTLHRELGRTARYQALAAAFATGLLTGGTTLSLYSLFGTAQVTVSTTYAQAGHFAALAGILGGVVLAITVAAWVAGRARNADLWSTHHRWELAATGTVALVLAFLTVRSWSEHLPSSYTALRAEMPYFAQLPTAVGATALVTLGSILVLPLVFHMGVARTLARGTMTTAVAVGLVLAATLGVLTVRAGDDSLNVDHRTAAPAEIPSTPEEFGAEAFRLQLPPLNNRPEATGREVLAAGSGFLVIGVDGLRAYDGATGAPRWHYLRRPQSGKRAMAYDRGSAVVTADHSVVTTRWTNRYDDPSRITFDAITGEVLWTSDDTNDFTTTSTGRLLGASSTTLIVETETTVAGYDARTGAHRWTAQTDGNCRSTRISPGVTANAVYRVLRCGGSTWRIIALDPGTGRAVSHRDLLAPASAEPMLTLRGNTVVVSSRSSEGNQYLLISDPASLSTTPVHTSDDPVATAPTGPTTVDNICKPRASERILPVPSSNLVVCQNDESIGNATLDIIGFR
ncbi:PQQ-binding-like beta-propeller repeat protein [Nocardia sp. NPDC050378]|uniref:outer membrane protein assembly factor BamB family protein n=1 Tax=Nocardia sp. NPDC050378 TaxID=3155400 RepID=UPI0033C2ECAA